MLTPTFAAANGLLLRFSDVRILLLSSRPHDGRLVADRLEFSAIQEENTRAAARRADSLYPTCTCSTQLPTASAPGAYRQSVPVFRYASWLKQTTAILSASGCNQGVSAPITSTSHVKDRARMSAKCLIEIRLSVSHPRKVSRNSCTQYLIT